MSHILIVDDESSIRLALEKYLKQFGFTIFTAADGEEGLKILESKPIDLALIDLVLPKLDGLSLLHRMKILSPETVAIVLTGFGTITSAVEAMKSGAYHYLTKPFELQDIHSLVQKALDQSKFKRDNIAVKKQIDDHHFGHMIGKSKEMESIFELIGKVAATDSTVLILGESGTGKELVAKAIHYQSPRKEKPLITVNCAAIPEELLESELFGHKKGSFTGAHQDTDGKFTAADGGTIFLDEIGEMSPKLQVKLLRVLQERKFEPVGSTQSKEVHVRIIAATNRDLEEAVKKGEFREDLFYRLNVIPILLPPLRERQEDVPLLLVHCLEKLNRAYNKTIGGFSEEAKKALFDYGWPGNIRELENTLERVILLKEKGKIEFRDLPDMIRGDFPSGKQDPIEIPETGLSFKQAISSYEDNLILKALKKTGWNKNKAASLLKLNRTTLVEKIKKRGLDEEIPSEGEVKNV